MINRESLDMAFNDSPHTQKGKQFQQIRIKTHSREITKIQNKVKESLQGDIQQYLARGGKIQHIATGQSGEKLFTR